MQKTTKNHPVGRYTSPVRPFEMDYFGYAALPVIFNYMIDAAGKHADERAFGIDDLRKAGKVWVLSRFLLEIDEYPTNIPVSVETWVETMESVFSVRKFSLHGNNNRILARASSSWALIDWENRRPQQLKDYIKDAPLFQNKAIAIEQPVKIELPSAAEKLREFTVKYTDLDINHHLNSARYIQAMLNCFSLEQFQNYFINHFQINFLAEVRYNETIEIYGWQENNRWLSELRKKNTNQAVARTEVIWTRK